MGARGGGKAKGYVPKVFFIRVRVGTLGRGRWGVNTVRPSVVESHDGSRDKK